MGTSSIGFRLVCLCLSTSSLRGFRTTFPAVRRTFGSSFVVADRPTLHNHLVHSRKAFVGLSKQTVGLIGQSTVLMSSDSGEVSNVGDGQSDIGRTTGTPPTPDDAKQYLDEGASWRSLLALSCKKSRPIRGSNYVQLATVDPETNEPRCRCVVFRGFLNLDGPLENDHPCAGSIVDDLSCVMQITTDLRSHKVGQILSHPNKASEIVWWFPASNEQYRIRGEILLIGGGKQDKAAFPHDNDPFLSQVRTTMWGKMSPAAQESFLQEKCTPGEPYQEEADKDTVGNTATPPDTFLLMLMLPKTVDYLRLTNMYRQIDRIDANTQQWTSVRVHP